MSTFGVVGEDRQDLNRKENRRIRQRSVTLLWDVVRQYRTRFLATVVLVVVSTALQVVGPTLIARGFVWIIRVAIWHRKSPIAWPPRAPAIR